MAHNIDYAWIDDDCVERYGTWTGDRAVAIRAACEALDAVGLPDGRAAYYASESGSWWAVESDDLAALGAALLDGHTLDEVYSVWCSSSGVEVDDLDHDALGPLV